MIYEVTAIAIDPERPGLVSEPRTETIDTETNELFQDCTGPWEIEDRYHEFWNRLNGSWEHDFPRGKEKVLVVTVEAVNGVAGS